MPLDGAEAPQLILVQPFVLAFLVIDFHRPAVAANTGDAGRMPKQAVADEKGRVVREVSLAIVDDQALFTKVVDLMAAAVAVVGLLLPFVIDADLVEDRLAFLLKRLQVFSLEPSGKYFHCLFPYLQIYL